MNASSTLIAIDEAAINSLHLSEFILARWEVD